MRPAMRPELAAKCLELIYVQATNAYLSSIAAGTVLISMFAGRADARWLWAFGLAYGAMIAIRAELGRRFAALPQPRRDGSRWLRRCGIAVTVCGVLWGAFALALASIADPYRLAAVVLTMGALISGAVAAYAVAPAIYLGFTVPAMMPLALWLLWQPLSEAKLLGALVVAWLLFMTSAALRFRRFALGALDLQFEHAQLVVSLAAERDRATALAQQLEVLSSTDPLTALANRRAFDEAFDEAWTAGARARHPLALVMCDIDHFKAYNDTYGHPQGDVALRRVADALSHAATRFGGTAARAGGEEFALLLPGADAERAGAAAESIRAAIEALAIPHVASALGVLTGSFGTAVMTPSRDNVPSDLVERADRALYAAKNAGRNRIMAEA